MTKQEFLSVLAGRSAALSQKEQQELISYYSEMIDDMTENGMSEEDAVRELYDSMEEAENAAAENTNQSEKAVIPAQKGEITDIYVTSICEDIRILPTDGEFIIDYDPKWSDVEAVEKDGRLSINLTQKVQKKLFGFINFSYYRSGHADIYLPRKDYRRLCVKTGSGDIKVDVPYFKELSLSAASGDIKIEAEQRLYSLDIAVESGDIDLDEDVCAVNAQLRAASGDISIARLQCENCSIETASGDTDIEELDCRSCAISAASGDVNVGLAKPVICSLKAVNGDIVYPEVQGTEGMLEVRTVNGDIKAENLYY